MAKSKITKIRLNSPGVVQLLKSNGVANDLSRRGNAIESNLPTDKGQEWRVDNYIGRDRAATVVSTANYEAKKDQAENHTLQRSLPAGGS